MQGTDSSRVTQWACRTQGGPEDKVSCALDPLCTLAYPQQTAESSGEWGGGNRGWGALLLAEHLLKPTQNPAKREFVCPLHRRGN